MSLVDKIDKENLPAHVAVIMDGNGRWAKSRGASRIFGHKNAIAAVRDVTEGCAELEVKFLTLYAFSTENWSRPQDEVNGLMQLLVHTIKGEIKTLMKNNVKLGAIGNLTSLPNSCQNELAEAIQKTSGNTGLELTLALSYSGRWEIIDAIKNIAKSVKENQLEIDKIDADLFRSKLMSSHIPDPELLIRTSGEMRISNFLLWQLAYTEIYITQKLWPDFRKNDLHEALLTYQGRERRFGQTSEQLN